MLKKIPSALTVNAGMNQAQEGKSALLICAFKFREIMKLCLICQKGAVSFYPVLLAKGLPLPVQSSLRLLGHCILKTASLNAFLLDKSSRQIASKTPR